MSKWYKLSWVFFPISMIVICGSLGILYGKMGAPLQGAGWFAMGVSMACFLTTFLLTGMIPIIAILADILAALHNTKDNTDQNERR